MLAPESFELMAIDVQRDDIIEFVFSATRQRQCMVPFD